MGRTRRTLAAGLVAAAVAAAGFVPAVDAAKKKGKGGGKVGGRIELFVPSFDPNTDTSLASGAVRAKRGCQSTRVLRFAWFTGDGVTPLANSPQPTVVSSPSGSYVVALTEPFVSETPQTIVLRAFAEGRKVTRKGKKITCKPIFGPPAAVTITG